MDLRNFLKSLFSFFMDESVTFIIAKITLLKTINEESKKFVLPFLQAIAKSIELLYKKQSLPQVTKVLHSFPSTITKRRRMKLKMYQDKYLCFGIFFFHHKFLKDLTCRYFVTLFSMIFLFNVLAHPYQNTGTII